jgi:hypothetical protein
MIRDCGLPCSRARPVVEEATTGLLPSSKASLQGANSLWVHRVWAVQRGCILQHSDPLWLLLAC